MKYAFLIPSGQQMVPNILFQQWVPFQEWLAKNEDGKIISMVASNQTEGRNKLLTQGNQSRSQRARLNLIFQYYLNPIL